MLSDIKAKFMKYWTETNFSLVDSLYYLACIGIGFFAGLFLRHYCKYIIGLLVITILLLTVLEFFNIIIINYSQIKVTFGFAESDSFSNIMNYLWNFIKIHKIAIGLMGVGYLLGFKIG